MAERVGGRREEGYSDGTVRTVLHISDLHFGALDREVADALKEYLKNIPRDVVVMSGDFTQRARAGQFREAVAYVRDLQTTGGGGGDHGCVWVPGNHDVPLWAVWERLTVPLGRYKKFVNSDVGPVWEDEELLVVGVATARAFVPVRDGFWKDGRIGVGQLGQVIQRAKANPHKAVIVVTHHPFIPAPGHRSGGVVLGGDKVLPLMTESGVDVLLAGHLHASYHGEIRVNLPGGKGERSVLSVQAGTATSHRRRHAPDGREYPNAFNLLKIDKERVEIEVHSYREGKFGIEGAYRYVRNKTRWESVAEMVERGGKASEVKVAGA